MDTLVDPTFALAQLCMDLGAAEKAFSTPITSFVAPDTCVRLVGTDPTRTDDAVSVEGIWKNRRARSSHEKLAFAEIEGWVEGMTARVLPILNGIAAQLNFQSPGMRGLIARGKTGAAVAAHVSISSAGNPHFCYALRTEAWNARSRAMTDGVGLATLAAVVECARVSGEGLDTGDAWVIVRKEKDQLVQMDVKAENGTDALLWAAATLNHDLLHTMFSCTVARVDQKASDTAKRRVQSHVASLFSR